ncbi:MAG: sensor histidine kinase, partial [Hyphomicrobiales bacterium]
MEVAGVYDPVLVSLSILVAVFASFAGLSLARRMVVAGGRARALWLITAAFALGGGIWAMHFVGMLAVSIPGLRISYDPGLTAISFAAPIGLTGSALAIAASNVGSRARLALAGSVMAVGVLAMHYLGMAAMQMHALVGYDPILVSLSVLIAFVASLVAVWLAFAKHKLVHRLAASLAMGIAIAGMHYTAMSAASFAPSARMDASM